MINYHKKIIILNKYNNIYFKRNKLIHFCFLDNFILLPGIILPINIVNKNLINYIYSKIYKKNKYISLFTRKNSNNINIKKNFYNLGVVTKIIKIYKMFDNSIIVILEGLLTCKIIKRKIIKIFNNILYLGEIKIINEYKTKNIYKNKKYNAYLYTIKDKFITLIKLTNKNNLYSNLINLINNIKSIKLLINYILINLNVPNNFKYLILKENKYKNKTKILLRFLLLEIKKINLSNNIIDEVKNEISNKQIDFFLTEQMKVIKKRLGENNEYSDVYRFKQKIKKINIPKDIYTKINNEILKLENININFPEYTIIKNYLDFTLSLPWNIYSTTNFNLKNSLNILNKNHYGLKEIKNRILEYLSVLKLNKYKNSPILCFVGPPGIGKTSLGKSISIVLSRKYIRISLGGLHDESEIRGHRKTYIGAMPGRILQSINKTKVSNPVILLDEIDKIGEYSHQGNPMAALLEVLDPEQNHSFYDNYLELEYNLSKVLFIATANNIDNIHPALLDRMEIIHINGYTIEEKLKIAKKFLIPKLLSKNGLKKFNIKINYKYIKIIIINYTLEAGIRNLEKRIDKIFRYYAKSIVLKKTISKLNTSLLFKILGPIELKYKYEKIIIPGVSIGLAWTGYGGDIIYIESSLSRGGKGHISITGNLGKIMKESVIISIKYLKSNYKKFNINLKYFTKYDIHIHIPEGATPKDGPSAGIAIISSLISTYTFKPLKNYLAMTGEITLRGKVLPVGGLEEKILAAKRNYINKIIFPYNNKNYIKSLTNKIKKNIKFFFIKEIYQLKNLIY